MSRIFGGSPPRKKSRSEAGRASVDYPDSDDSFNDPVLEEPSQLTQTILQRREAYQRDFGTQSQLLNRALSNSRTNVYHLQPAASDEGKRKSLHVPSSITPRRFNSQEKSEYHHNGQLMMLKNRLENMERERERLAATTRDQLIAKEKHHAAELREKDYHIRQLEAQIQSLRQENLHTSFQVHNVTMSENVDIEMAAVDTTPATGSALPTKRVSIPRSDEGWKNVSRFGPAASVFGNMSTSDRFRNENGSETFAHIPSQLLIDPPVPHSDFRVPASALPVTLQPRKSFIGSASKECQIQGVSDYWNVRSAMQETSLEALLSFSTLSDEHNFDLSAIKKLCQTSDHLELGGCLEPTKLAINSSAS